MNEYGAILLVFLFWIFSSSRPSPTLRPKVSPPNSAVRSSFPSFLATNGVVPTLKVSVAATFDHNESHFTQGFEILDGYLYEGTGLNSKSALMKKNLTTGRILQYRALDSRYFGEGITIFGNQIYQLTWKNRVGFFYDLSSLKLIGSWNYNYDGWGLTHDDKYIIVSDGTSTIRFLDPEGDLAKPAKTLSVKFPNGQEQNNLNELEYIDGNIWANVWLTHSIVVIDPSTGVILAKLDLTDLRKPDELGGDVLNGIAFDRETGNVYLTGKLWKKMYEVVPRT